MSESRSELVTRPVEDPAGVAPASSSVAELDEAVTRCVACPRLVEWRERVAAEKRAAFRDQRYWGRPVPGFGPTDASVALVGLAPAAHGANRTGRMFTGDRSGEFLYRALFDVGMASAPVSEAVDDGLRLNGVRITAPVRCAPPANKPTPAERENCRPWLARELELLRPTLRAVVVLGSYGWQSLLPVLAADGWSIPRPRPKFGHGAERTLSGRDGGELHLLGCYHVSQQNTFTGRLTLEMLREVLERAKVLAGAG